MNTKDRHDTFIENIHSALDASLDDIDAATQSKITQARHRALEQRTKKGPLQIWLPVGAVATTCVALIMFSLVPKTQVEDTAPLDDLEMISNIDDLELLEELEFYEWLEEYELPA